MLKISLNNPESGWAYARLSDESKELLVTAPYSPDDVLRDFVDAAALRVLAPNSIQRPLRTANSVLHWSLRRMDKDIEIEILKFPDIGFPGQHRGNAEPIFKARGRWATFATQLLSSLESIKTEMGCEGYERAWRHPFPIEAYEKLRNAVQRGK
jgi:hypothetical protein